MKTPKTRTHDYVCMDCGVKYLSPSQTAKEGNIITCHSNICCLCEKGKIVTHIRNYNYLIKPITL